jgi:hypothetical protein
VSAGIAWGLAARLLADGATPAVVAEEAGGTAAQIMRRRRDDRGFRRWIEEARHDPTAPPADAESRAVRHLLTLAHQGDPRALAWLARHRQTRPRAEEGLSLEEILAKLTPDELADFVALGDDGPVEPGDEDGDVAGDGPGDDPADDGGDAGETPASGHARSALGTPPPGAPAPPTPRYPPPVLCPRWWEGS